MSLDADPSLFCQKYNITHVIMGLFLLEQGSALSPTSRVIPGPYPWLINTIAKDMCLWCSKINSSILPVIYY